MNRVAAVIGHGRCSSRWVGIGPPRAVRRRAAVVGQATASVTSHSVVEVGFGRNGVADVVPATVTLMIVGSFHGVDERRRQRWPVPRG
jgi:hypothetical protein